MINTINITINHNIIIYDLTLNNLNIMYDANIY